MGETAPRLVGRRVPRIEDPSLLRGEGRYLDDITLPDTLHAVFIRSVHAHAGINGIDTAAALAMPGVVAVLTAEDMAAVLTSLRLPPAFPPGVVSEDAMPPVLASGEAHFVGEPIAVVVAESRYLAEDAAELVEVDYEIFPALADPRNAEAADAPLATNASESNLFVRTDVSYGDCDGAFAGAAHIFSETLHQHRGPAHPMEGRAIMATVEPGTGVLKVWSSTQVAHELRDNIVALFGVEVDDVRVITSEVGGGFGAKFMVYPEELAVVAAARMLGRPVKWIEDRREHFLSSYYERDQFWTLEIAVDREGRLEGVRGRLVHDQGAYAPHSITVPYNSACSLPGVYRLPALHIQIDVVRTNKPPVISIRGAGYPQGAFAMERLMDLVADRMKLGRAEVRRRNLVKPSQMPYAIGLKNRAGRPVVYDSGNYEACQDMALQTMDYAGFAARQASARDDNKFLGMGIAHGLKCTGRGPFESARIVVTPTGRISVYTGAIDIGQGTKSTLAQLCADTLGARLSDIDVTCGDTAFIPYGIGAYGSRQIMIAGTSVQKAAASIREKILAVAAQMLAPEISISNSKKDLAIIDSEVRVSDRPDLSIPLSRISTIMRGAPGYAYPEGVSVGLEATEYFRVDDMAYANAFHVCEVEVDIETGHVTILKYLALQDSGTIVNPLTSEGQIYGGVVHGIGNALFESMQYDDQAQPVTTTFADFLLPTATEIPHIRILMHETPSPLNPLGMKGVGEVSIVPVTSVVISAIENALQPFGVRIRECPISPIRLKELIRGQTAKDRHAREQQK